MHYGVNIPWNGGKRWLTADLSWVFSSLKKPVTRYVEPFVGSASVAALYLHRTPALEMFEELPTTRALLGDANPWLVFYLRCVRDQVDVGPVPTTPDGIQQYRNYSDADYSGLTEAQRGLRFAVCLLTAWGNRWETQDDGTFRSTMNPEYCRPGYLTERVRRAFTSLDWLGPNVDVTVADWVQTVGRVQEGDLVYLDPPYIETLGYGNQVWNLANLLDLVDWISDTIRGSPGVRMVVSHSATGERLFSRLGLTVLRVSQGVKSTQTRREREEIIAWNG